MYPEIFLTTAICVLLVYGAFAPKISTISHERKTRSIINNNLFFNISWLGIFSLAITLFLLPTVNGASVTIFNNLLIVDDLTTIVKGIILISSIATLFISMAYVKRESINAFEFTLLLLLAILGLLCLVSSNDLISLYLAIELQSLCLYVVAAFKRDSEHSVEAGLKYFVLGALSSGLLLFGSALIYAYTGTTNFDQLLLLNLSSNLDQAVTTSFHTGFIIGIIFLSFGLLFKLAAVPFHMWAPDVYEGSPTSVTAFFAIVPKVAILAVFARLYFTVFYDIIYIHLQGQGSIVFLNFCAIGSMVVGAFGALKQHNIKRLLAYSAIGHMGYMLIGISTGTLEGLEALFIYIMIYIIMTIGTFSVVISLRKSKNISDLNGLNQANPLLAFSLAIILFSTAGIPPLAGFFSKLFLFFSAMSSSMYLLVIVGIFTSVVGCFYYLRLIKVAYFSQQLSLSDTRYLFKSIFVTKEVSILLGIVLFWLILFIFYPSPLFVVAHKIALALCV
jgi:NADH-quinone oxidoreductase subunit N